MEQQFTTRQLDIITGSLLGDGSLKKKYNGRNSAFCEMHGDKQYEYLYWKCRELKPYSLGVTLEMHKEIIGRSGDLPIFGTNKSRKIWSLRTCNHAVFSELESKWYLREGGEYVFDDSGRRIKIVPRDIKLSPLSVAVWFFDDGTNYLNCNNQGRNASFYTLAFTEDECEILVKELIRLGISDCGLRRCKKSYEVVVYSKSFDLFMEMVTPFLPCQALSHKVFFKPKAVKPVKITYDIVSKIKKMSEAGSTGKLIAADLGVSQATVSMVLSGEYNTKCCPKNR